VTVIQVTELVAIQKQFVPVVTETALVLPTDDTDTLVGETVAVHWASAGRTPTTNVSTISTLSTQQCRSLMDMSLEPA
jgi:hypothetical protein